MSLLLWFQTPAPASAEEWKKIGIAGVSARKLPAALAAFEKACALEPKDEDACYYLARTLYTLDRWREAQNAFDKALPATPKAKLARIHRAMALNYLALGNSVAAEQHFRLAVLLNQRPGGLPEDPRVDYGAFLFRQGRVEEALPMLKEAVQASPRSARANAELGRVLLHVDKPDAAVTSLRKAVELDPRDPAVRLLLGRAYLRVGRTEDGERELRLAQQGLTQNQGSSTIK